MPRTLRCCLSCRKPKFLTDEPAGVDASRSTLRVRRARVAVRTLDSPLFCACHPRPCHRPRPSRSRIVVVPLFLDALRTSVPTREHGVRRPRINGVVWWAAKICRRTQRDRDGTWGCHEAMLRSGAMERYAPCSLTSFFPVRGWASCPPFVPVLLRRRPLDVHCQWASC